VDAREFFRWQARGELPALAAHGVVAEAAGECALGTQIVAFLRIVAIIRFLINLICDRTTIDFEL
jgi:hypothetical protein